MTKDKVDVTLRVVLSVILFSIPIALALIIWCTPELEKINSLVTLGTFNVVLGVAEIMFLVRAAIFPRNGRKWWREEW